MKITFGVSDSITKIGALFLCLYAFVSTLLLMNGTGINSTTLVAALGLIVIIGLMAYILKRHWKSKRYDFLIPFVFLPSIAMVAGLVIPILQK